MKPEAPLYDKDFLIANLKVLGLVVCGGVTVAGCVLMMEGLETAGVILVKIIAGGIAGLTALNLFGLTLVLVGRVVRKLRRKPG